MLRFLALGNRAPRALLSQLKPQAQLFHSFIFLHTPNPRLVTFEALVYRGWPIPGRSKCLPIDAARAHCPLLTSVELHSSELSEGGKKLFSCADEIAQGSQPGPSQRSSPPPPPPPPPPSSPPQRSPDAFAPPPAIKDIFRRRLWHIPEASSSVPPGPSYSFPSRLESHRHAGSEHKVAEGEKSWALTEAWKEEISQH